MPPTLLQQLAYQYETDKTAAAAAGDLLMDSNIGQSLQQFRQQQERAESDHAVQERAKKTKMLHERDQDIHQQSINSLLLNLPMPPSPNSYAGSKYSHDISSPSKGVPPSLEDTSISDLFGLGMPRGSLMGAGQKEQVGSQAGFDTPTNRSYYQRREKSNGYHSNSTTLEQDTTGYYSNMSNVDVPSSPVSIRTPASPSTPGSLYSNTYSSVSSTAYTADSVGSNSYNKRFPASPVRSPSYGRPIRGSPPYSDCSSPSAEYPSYNFGCNSSRSNSPADSENSVNSIDGPLSDIMNYLSINSGQNRNYPSNPNEAEKYLQNNRNSIDLQKLEKFLYNSHQQQQSSQTPGHHHHHYHSHGHSRSHNYNQQYNGSYINPVFGSDKFCCFDGPRNIPVNSLPNPTTTPHLSLDKAARIHRSAAATTDLNFTWSGSLPQRTQKPIGYSSKVFLGGVPWDITESVLISTFKQFGQIRIEWPGKGEATSQPKGYVYLIFESEKQVKALLSCCIHDFSNGGSYYYKISSKRMKGKQVQVIPWALNESNFVKSSSQKLDPEKTVFVGALHGMMTAIGLAKVMNDLFDNVVYAGIDTDRHKYPIGSARVTFSNKHSFHKAIKAAFVVVKTPKFTKKLQVNPYIEDHPCSSCSVQQGPYFCRELVCFKYYCHTCWHWVHNNVSMIWHEPVSRGMKNNHVIGMTPSGGTNRSSNLL